MSDALKRPAPLPALRHLPRHLSGRTPNAIKNMHNKLNRSSSLLDAVHTPNADVHTVETIHLSTRCVDGNDAGSPQTQLCRIVDTFDSPASLNNIGVANMLPVTFDEQHPRLDTADAHETTLHETVSYAHETALYTKLGHGHHRVFSHPNFLNSGGLMARDPLFEVPAPA